LISFQTWFRATLKFFKIILFRHGTTALVLSLLLVTGLMYTSSRRTVSGIVPGSRRVDTTLTEKITRTINNSRRHFTGSSNFITDNTRPPTDGMEDGRDNGSVR